MSVANGKVTVAALGNREPNAPRDVVGDMTAGGNRFMVAGKMIARAKAIQQEHFAKYAPANASHKKSVPDMRDNSAADNGAHASNGTSEERYRNMLSPEIQERLKVLKALGEDTVSSTEKICARTRKEILPIFSRKS